MNKSFSCTQSFFAFPFAQVSKQTGGPPLTINQGIMANNFRTSQNIQTLKSIHCKAVNYSFLVQTKQETLVKR